MVNLSLPLWKRRPAIAYCFLHGGNGCLCGHLFDALAFGCFFRVGSHLQWILCSLFVCRGGILRRDGDQYALCHHGRSADGARAS